MTRMVSISIEGRPALLNQERSQHWRRHRESTALVRTEARLRIMAMGAMPKGPWDGKPFTKVKVDVWPYYAKGPLPDTGGMFPAVKAIIDGADDAGLIPNDRPETIKHLAFWHPRVDKAMGDLLVVTFEDLEEDSAWLS